MNKLHLKIGTSSSNELVLEEVGIDPHHLELFCDEYGNVFITDLKSTNGTFKITPFLIKISNHQSLGYGLGK